MAYEQVVFLQGDEAEEALEIFREDGADAAADHLKQWHYPGEHEVRATSGAGGSDDVTNTDDGYILTVNTGLDYIGLEFNDGEGDE